MGKGNDVKEGRGAYNDFELVAAWKADTDIGLLNKYIKTVGALNGEYQAQGRTESWVPTFHDSLQQELRSTGLLDSNEYWLMRGIPFKYLKQLFNRVTRDGPLDDAMGYFGAGVYFADVSDKADQYMSTEADLNELADLVGEHGINEDVFVLPVFRVFLGAHIELSFENLLSPFGNGNAEPRVWHYVDPRKSSQVAIKDVPENRFNKKVPGSFGSYDSIKVMSTMYHPDFGKTWNFSKPEWAMPRKHDEYLMPIELVSEATPRFAVSHLIAYRRVEAIPAQPAR